MTMCDIDAWVWWLIGAVGLGIPLVLTAMPEFGMFAVGARGRCRRGRHSAAAVVVQVLVFAVVSVALIAVVRPDRDPTPRRPARNSPPASTP